MARYDLINKVPQIVEGCEIPKGRICVCESLTDEEAQLLSRALDGAFDLKKQVKKPSKKAVK